MTTGTATQPLLDRFLHVRKTITMACGERCRMLPNWLVTVMTWRIHAVCKPAVRLFQRLIAGTYRPSKPRTRPQSAPRARLPVTVPELEDPYWLIRLLPSIMSARFTVGAARYDLEALIADPAMVALMQEVPTLARHIRPLCRMLHFDLPAHLRPKSKPRAAHLPKQGPPKPADAPKRAYFRRAPPPPPPAPPVPVRIEPEYPGTSTPLGSTKNW